MSVPLRDIRLVRDGEKQRAPNLIGLDESTTTVEGTRYTIVVAVRTAREDDISLLRALIENDLQPFKHKSSSLLRYGDVSVEERARRAQGLIEDLRSLPVSWNAILWEGSDKAIGLATCAVTAVKNQSRTHSKWETLPMDVAKRCSFMMVVKLPTAIIFTS